MAIARTTVFAGLADVIRFSRVSTGERVSTLVDGSRVSGCADDEPHSLLISLGPPGNEISLGNMIPGSASCLSSEVVVFSQDHAIEMRPGMWTTRANDVLPVTMKARVVVPVNVYILFGPFGDVKLDAAAHIGNASEIFNEMAGGVIFVPTYFDKTMVPAAPGLALSDCDVASTFTGIGPLNNRLSVYYIDQVGGRSKARWCGNLDNPGDAMASPNVVLVGDSLAEPESLAHEFGHALTLHHVNQEDSVTHLATLMPKPGFTVDNLMMTLVTGRQTLSTGQVFRASTNVLSAINRNHNRMGQTRTCGEDDVSAKCPKLAIDLPK